MRYVYTVLLWLAMPFILLRLLWRSRHMPDKQTYLPERFGFVPFTLEKCLWIHAVSVGETIAAIPLIKRLQEQYPQLPLVVTNMTVTGAARVKAAFGDSIFQTYIPYDFPEAVARFLNGIHPRIAIIMETELWPNLFAACSKRGIPLVMVNARLSERSAKGYQKIATLTRDMLQAVTRLAAQTEADAKRFVALGLSKEKITVTGNIKFDLSIPTQLKEQAEQFHQALGQQRFIWVAASTHPTEEEMVLAAHRTLLSSYPNALLLLVPRHPNRFDTVADLIQQQGFKMMRRQHGGECTADITVYLGDTMGELLLMYAVSDVAFVAGSFANVGGHNMLEPAVLRKPILAGPVLFNFADISQLLLMANGMQIVSSSEALAEALSIFAVDSAYRKKVGDQAYQVVEANRGALDKQLDLIHSVLQEKRNLL